ncbi:hypothetical protein E2C01_085581 [Portunus trituberculatus]|uniref:Uncharacterized protein n=1 Tax=Portunus trituberculatus TaxID=210409 RepID=A0A5B7J998_PORTR|nr:hypothetical protein [Portunus trituberculatus]
MKGSLDGLPVGDNGRQRLNVSSSGLLLGRRGQSSSSSAVRSNSVTSWMTYGALVQGSEHSRRFQC